MDIHSDKLTRERLINFHDLICISTFLLNTTCTVTVQLQEYQFCNSAKNRQKKRRGGNRAVISQRTAMTVTAMGNDEIYIFSDCLFLRTAARF
ncbi:hypothetical protein CDAR_105751 [Caerostris darwini]|uniref:Uncharacterized protein n=1 Tax=Caerostris darwini TaxID=1538125 RepID=A0AAV4TVV0_9ARAC|nr:hypothetical protein CDAR_105751 [Caerostris darwini]